MRCASIIGRKNAGKTTLLVALVREFRRHGHRVATIKHAHHPADTDTRGTDSWRHFTEGESDQTLLVSPTTRTLFERVPDQAGPRELAQRFFPLADLVLVEGFKSAGLPCVEVHRREIAEAPIHNPDDPGAKNWIALMTDDSDLRATCPVLRFQDTMWLHLLASMILERAEVLG